MHEEASFLAKSFLDFFWGKKKGEMSFVITNKLPSLVESGFLGKGIGMFLSSGWCAPQQYGNDRRTTDIGVHIIIA